MYNCQLFKIINFVHCSILVVKIETRSVNGNFVKIVLIVDTMQCRSVFVIWGINPKIFGKDPELPIFCLPSICVCTFAHLRSGVFYPFPIFNTEKKKKVLPPWRLSATYRSTDSKGRKFWGAKRENELYGGKIFHRYYQAIAFSPVWQCLQTFLMFVLS